MDLRSRLSESGVFLSLIDLAATELFHPSPQELLEAQGINNKTRLMQYILGRRAAGHALNSAGMTSKVSIPRTVRTAPAWPTGYVGSISHATNLIGAVAALSTRYRSLGLDIEVATRKTSERLLRRITSEHDYSLSLSPLQLFSIKEACYKASRPLTPNTFAFKSILLAQQQPQTPRTLKFKVSGFSDTLCGEIVYEETRGHFIAIATIPC